MQVINKVIVVTGGANGVGREIVLQLLKKGASVATVDIDEVKLKETYQLAGKSPKLSIHRTDITVREEVEKLVTEVVGFHGHVDGIINNAGIIQPFVDLHQLELNRIDKVMDVNFYGTLHMIRGFMPYLEKRAEAHITNVSSMGGFFPVPGQSIYGASKAAVKLMTEALYAELEDTAIDVSVVIPGGIATNIMKNSDLEVKETQVEAASTKFLLTPEKAAKLIIKSMEKNKFRMIIGKDANLMCFLYQLKPKMAIRLMKKMLALQ